MQGFLTGNSFPLGLVRRRVVIEPRGLDEYRARLAEGGWVSYWGHENTLAAAQSVCGYDLRPLVARPAVTLDEAGYPSLGGKSYRECWVLSGEYEAGYRPAVGEEVAASRIVRWQVLRMTWE